MADAGSSTTRWIVVPARDLLAVFGMAPDQVDSVIGEQFRAYRTTFPDDRRRLFERFQVVEVAPEVVASAVWGPGHSSFCDRDTMPTDGRS